MKPMKPCAFCREWGPLCGNCGHETGVPKAQCRCRKCHCEEAAVEAAHAVADLGDRDYGGIPWSELGVSSGG
jgi:hypothetical protein